MSGEPIIQTLPKVTVLMPVYNGETYIGEAIDSILGQSFTDFELLIVNDGSTDSSREIVMSYPDPRVRVVDNGRNYGQGITRNRGVDLARGEYIALMDCDDVSLVYRLEKQVSFMDTHPEVGVCGSFMIMRWSGGGVSLQCYAAAHDEIKCKMFLNSEIANPTSMIRRSVLLKNALHYREDYVVAQDYDLWARMLNITRFANLQLPLVIYRAHESSMSAMHFALQRQNAARVRRNMLNAMELSPTEEELAIHEGSIRNDLAVKEHFGPKVIEWRDKLIWANAHRGEYAEPYFSQLLASIFRIERCCTLPSSQ